jgi:hypothetical protein
MSLEEKIQYLLDIEAVKQHKTRWCDTIDAGLGIEKVVSFFAADGWIEAEGYGRHQGRPALTHFLSNLPLSFTFHCIIPKVVEIGADGLTAHGEFRLWEPGTLPGRGAGGPAAVWVAGDYDDDFVKVAGEWKFKAVRLKLTFLTPYDQGWVKKRFAE